MGLKIYKLFSVNLNWNKEIINFLLRLFSRINSLNRKNVLLLFLNPYLAMVPLAIFFNYPRIIVLKNLLFKSPDSCVPTPVMARSRNLFPNFF